MRLKEMIYPDTWLLENHLIASHYLHTGDYVEFTN